MLLSASSGCSAHGPDAGARADAGREAAGDTRIALVAERWVSAWDDTPNLDSPAYWTGDGNHWVINGHKQWITNGKSASVYVVRAQTDASLGRAGVGGFIVARGPPGVVAGRQEAQLGIRAAERLSSAGDRALRGARLSWHRSIVGLALARMSHQGCC